MNGRDTLVDTVARAICCGKRDGSCGSEGGCMAQEMYGTTATKVVSQLRKRGLINAAAERKLCEGT